MARFGHTPQRLELLQGLEAGLRLLHAAGCEAVYVGGSFVTDKENRYGGAPNDFDACWEESGVDIPALDEVFFNFSNRRAAQKARFGGEFFPARAIANPKNRYVDFFQIDKNTKRLKGIVKIFLETLPEPSERRGET